MKLFGEHIENGRQPQHKDAIANFLGPVGSAVVDVVQITVVAIIVLDLARAWRSNVERINSYVTLPAVVANNLLLRLALTVALVSVWIYAFVRWFRWIGWPRIWAVAFVILILCPVAWVFAQRFRPGIDWVLLLLLQSPIMVLFILRVRARARQHRNPK
jgi:hypothetical protein